MQIVSYGDKPYFLGKIKKKNVNSLSAEFIYLFINCLILICLFIVSISFIYLFIYLLDQNTFSEHSIKLSSKSNSKEFPQDRL